MFAGSPSLERSWLVVPMAPFFVTITGMVLAALRLERAVVILGGSGAAAAPASGPAPPSQWNAYYYGWWRRWRDRRSASGSAPAEESPPAAAAPEPPPSPGEGAVAPRTPSVFMRAALWGLWKGQPRPAPLRPLSGAGRAIFRFLPFLVPPKPIFTNFCHRVIRNS